MTWFEKDPAALATLERTLRARYPTLHAFIEKGMCVVHGTLPIEHQGSIADRYTLSIELPEDYPRSLPVVWETANRIPRELDRHVITSTGQLCIGVPIELWIQLCGDFSIEQVLDIPVRNFLIGNSLVERGEPWPHGDHAHGAAGVLEFYADLLGTTDPMLVVKLLLDVLHGKVRGHWPCPCGSGAIIRKCHKNAVDELRKVPESVLVQSGNLVLKILKDRQGATSGATAASRTLAA